MLKEHNLFFVNQAIELLQRLTNQEYATPSLLLNSGGIGPHIRHCIEHYQSFLDGLPLAKIDYDARKRDKKMETNIEYGIECLNDVYVRLERLETIDSETLHVKMETNADENEPAVWMVSSVGREMMSLVSHTVHHFAIVALLLNGMNKAVPRGFGVAPSTLKFQAQSTN